MAAIDLTRLSEKDLGKLSSDITKEIKSRQDEERKRVLKEMKDLAASIGSTVEELVGTSAPKKRRIPPKYRNPKDASQTWTGRGKQPRWIRDSLASGKKLTDLAVD
ncbi:MAG: H-NS histone family protein [Pseudomonadota bacterium]|nr:H-NS histone family protein [Pseudomonadota bacterium]